MAAQAQVVLTLQQFEKLIPALHIVATKLLGRQCVTEQSSTTSWKGSLTSR